MQLLVGKLVFKPARERVKEASHLSHRLQIKVASMKDIWGIPNIPGHEAVSKPLHLPFCALEGHPQEIF